MLNTVLLDFSAATDTGKVRSENQDRWLADSAIGLFAIADGMGGHAAGALAAQLVIDVLPQVIRRAISAGSQATLQETAVAIAREVKGFSEMMYEEARQQPGISGTGTTLVLAVVEGACAAIVHAGDSRAYLFRDGELHQLTRDHTLAEMLAAQPRKLDTGGKRHSAARKLTRYIGMPTAVAPDTQVIDVAAGDLLMLCSDGLYGQVEDDEVCAILKSTIMIEQKCEELVAAANRAGGSDNVTVLLVSRME